MFSYMLSEGIQEICQRHIQKFAYFCRLWMKNACMYLWICYQDLGNQYVQLPVLQILPPKSSISKENKCRKVLLKLTFSCRMSPYHSNKPQSTSLKPMESSKMCSFSLMWNCWLFTVFKIYCDFHQWRLMRDDYLTMLQKIMSVCLQKHVLTVTLWLIEEISLDEARARFCFSNSAIFLSALSSFITALSLASWRSCIWPSNSTADKTKFEITARE